MKRLMLKEEPDALVHYRFKQAKRVFRDAEMLLEEGSYSSAVNRFYGGL